MEYLNPEQIKSGTLTWSRNGNPTGSISIQVNTHSKQPYIELDYKYRDEPRNYKVYLTSTLSNLNRGEIWYFICPKTGRRCRILHLIDTYFYHRSAVDGCMYKKQTQSKKSRYLNKMLGDWFQTAELFEQINKKNFKKTYAGKLTKKYLRIIEQLQKSEKRLIG